MRFFQGLIILISINAYGQSAFPTRAIDSLIQRKQRAYEIPGIAVSIVHEDTILYNKGFGIADVNNKHVVDQNTVFHTASISKLFTAQAVVELVNQNRFALDDHIGSLLPEFKMADQRYKEITVRQLLNHTAGLPDVVDYDWSNNPAEPDVLKKYISGFSTKKLKSDPGKEFYYSSMGYDLLGYLVERISAEPFALYMQRTILQPASMIHSGFDYHKISQALVASPHTKSLSGTVVTRKTYPFNPAHAPSSTLNSSSTELAKWIMNFLAMQEHLSVMTTPSSNHTFIGLGWFIGKIDQEKTLYHFGGDRGFRSYLIILPERKMGLVLLANCDYDEDFRQEILHGIIRVLQTSAK